MNKDVLLVTGAGQISMAIARRTSQPLDNLCGIFDRLCGAGRIVIIAALLRIVLFFQTFR